LYYPVLLYVLYFKRNIKDDNKSVKLERNVGKAEQTEGKRVLNER